MQSIKHSPLLLCLVLSLSAPMTTLATTGTASSERPRKHIPTKAHKTTLATHKKSAAHRGGEHEPEFTNFGQWKAVGEFIDQMSSEHGFDRADLHAQFAKTHYVDKVVKLINPPPASKAKNWTLYRDRFVEPKRIQAGLAFWSRHEKELLRAQAEFGVPPEIIVGILGVETLYGQHTGNIRVMDALTTLAFAYPETPNRLARMEYFRSELRQAMLYARESNIDPFTLSGSFAGAIGLPQFMPGSIRRFAVDFDGDGRIDLRHSTADAIGSVASFLTQHGWTTDLPLVYPAQPDPASESVWKPLIGIALAATHSVNELSHAGVLVTGDATGDVPGDLMVGLVDLQDGERPTRYFVGTENFFALTKYNRSYYYAMAVIELGNAIRQQRRS